MVSAIINQRSFFQIQALGLQAIEPPELKNSLGKMASHDISDGQMLHIDLSASFPTLVDNRYTVNLDGNKVHINLSEVVGLDAGLGTGADNKPKLGGLAHYTVHIECDLGQDGHEPRIESIHFQQELLPYEAAPVKAQ